MYTALDVALWFLQYNDYMKSLNKKYYSYYDVFEGIPEQKLQLLLYNVKGISLAINNDTFFNENIIKGDSTPIVESIHDMFSIYTDKDIIVPFSEEFYGRVNNIPIDFNSYASNLLSIVYNEFAKYTTWELRKMATKEGTPFDKTDDVFSLGEVIKNDLIKKYFTKNIIKKIDIKLIEKIKI